MKKIYIDGDLFNIHITKSEKIVSCIDGIIAIAKNISVFENMVRGKYYDDSDLTFINADFI